MAQEEQIIERLNDLGFPIVMGEPMRPIMMNLAAVLTRKAAEPDMKHNHLMVGMGLMAFAIASLCEKEE